MFETLELRISPSAIITSVVLSRPPIQDTNFSLEPVSQPPILIDMGFDIPADPYPMFPPLPPFDSLPGIDDILEEPLGSLYLPDEITSDDNPFNYP